MRLSSLPTAPVSSPTAPKITIEKYYGITTLRRALEASYNASAVKLQQLAGSRSVVETARKFGISTELHPYPSLALGSLGVRLIDLVRAYSGIANLGEVPEPYFIAEIFDRDERLQERHFPHSERVMPEAVTYLALYMLRGVVEHGTGVSARWLGANLAGKTGTTDLYSDAWFVGFSPRITVGVWVGRDLKAPIGKNDDRRQSRPTDLEQLHDRVPEYPHSRRTGRGFPGACGCRLHAGRCDHRRTCCAAVQPTRRM